MLFGLVALCLSFLRPFTQFFDPPSRPSRLTKVPSILQVGVNAVSWEPATGGDSLSPKRLVTAGCDNTVKIWQFDEAAQVRQRPAATARFRSLAVLSPPPGADVVRGLFAEEARRLGS